MVRPIDRIKHWFNSRRPAGHEALVAQLDRAPDYDLGVGSSNLPERAISHALRHLEFPPSNINKLDNP